MKKPNPHHDIDPETGNFFIGFANALLPSLAIWSLIGVVIYFSIHGW